MYPKEKMVYLNGLVQYGAIGPVRALSVDTMRGFMRAPFFQTDHSHTRPDCDKILMCNDQIFFRDIEGDPFEPFRYNCSYQDVPEGVENKAWTGDRGGLIAIQLHRQIYIKGVEITGYKTIGDQKATKQGEVRVCLGSNVDRNGPLLCKFDVNKNGIAYPQRFTKEKSGYAGNVILIKVGPYTEVPYFTFLVDAENLLTAMSDTVFHIDPSRPDVSTLFASEKEMVPDQKSLEIPFKTVVHRVEMDKVYFDNELRVNPAFGHPDWEGDSLSLDSQLRNSANKSAYNILKLTHWPDHLKGDVAAMAKIAAEFVIRYGQNKKHSTKIRPIDIVGDWKSKRNDIEIGLDVIKGIHIDGNDLSDDPIAVAYQQAVIYTACKTADEKIQVGLTMKADRNFVYFSSQNMRTVMKGRYADYFVIKFTSYEELHNLYSIFGFCSTYFYKIPIYVEIDFDFDWREYPALVYILIHWRVKKVILNSYDRYFRENGLNSVFLAFSTWQRESREMLMVRIHVFENTVHFIGKYTTDGARHHFLCRGLNTKGQQIKYLGTPLEMPLSCPGKYLKVYDGSHSGLKLAGKSTKNGKRNDKRGRPPKEKPSNSYRPM